MLKTRKFKKSLSFILIISILIGMFTFPVNSVDNNNTYDFANFTEADSMAFVEEHDIEIPLNLQQLDCLPQYTRELILQAYETPNTSFCFNYPPTQTYAEEIRLAVRSYLDSSAIPMTASTTNYTLLYNTVQDANGNWVTSGGIYNPKWPYYNCYAFAINRAERPNFYYTGKQYQPGDMAGTGYFEKDTTVEQLAEIVCDDLEAMGYSDISTSYSIPTINSSQELICVRIKLNWDYHFMRYDINTDAWYHKPGYTAILKYNYVPTDSLMWYTEHSDAQGNIQPSSSTYYYDSDIIFITYSKNQITAGQNNTSREYIEPEKDVFCEINVGSSGHYEITLESDYSFEYEIYNDEFDVVLSGSGTSIDDCLVATAGKYYLRMNFVSYEQLSYVDVSIRNHSHSYTFSYTWLSFTQHSSMCHCRTSVNASHVVPAGSFTNGAKRATCLQCGGLATEGMVSINVSELPHTANGSYILPNGVIVLEPEDMEAYMNGTLVFSIDEVA